MRILGKICTILLVLIVIGFTNVMIAGLASSVLHEDIITEAMRIAVFVVQVLILLGTIAAGYLFYKQFWSLPWKNNTEESSSND